MIVALVLGVAVAVVGSPADAVGAPAGENIANIANVTNVGDDEAPRGERRAVSLLPLTALGTVTGKQAKGVTAQLRAAAESLARDDVIRLLATTKDDDAALRRCGGDAACFDDVARLRGADRLVTGAVTNAGTGLLVTLQLHPGSKSATTTLEGNDDDDTRLDRIVREVFAEDTLRGTLRVEGQAGDEVVLDARRRGTLQEPKEGGPAAFQIEKLREGAHNLVVTRPISKNGTAYEPFTRAVAVRHRETTTVKVTLLPKASTASLTGNDEAAVGGGVPVAAIATVGVGVVGVGVGIVFGVLSLQDSQAVEARAATQQLVFPRDQELVDRGATSAVVANVAYGVGAAAIVGGVAWWLLAPTPEAL